MMRINLLDRKMLAHAEKAEAIKAMYARDEKICRVVLFFGKYFAETCRGLAEIHGRDAADFRKAACYRGEADPELVRIYDKIV